MNADEWDQLIRTMPHVQSDASMGYRFYYVSDDHRLPFATIADNGNPHESVSALDRPGVFRLNIGVRPATFARLFPQGSDDVTDFTVLNVLLPHPHYAKQSFVCILNPAGDNIERTRALLAEAHAYLVERR